MVRVLVLAPDPTLGDIRRLVLRKAGFDAETCAPPDCSTLITHKRFDAPVLCRLPGWDASDTVSSFRRLNQGGRVVAVQEVRHPLADVTVYPFDPEALVLVLNDHHNT